VALFAKAPIAGLAKTRLIPALGPEGAAALHARMVRHALTAATAAGVGEVSVWCAPSREHPFFASLEGASRLLDQPQGDLGDRMQHAFQEMLKAGPPVVLIGSDAPELGAERIRGAAEGLHGGADVVLVPALDGGYALIGLRRAHWSLFSGVDWGTGSVLAQTRRRIDRLGWSVLELPAVRDVDRPEDLEWLRASDLLSDARQGIW
jgi:rSAM/selenodomain-associated transferase 1